MDSQLKENVFLPISDQELNRRWSAVRKEMKKQEIDCLVIQNSEAHMGGYVRWFIDIPAKFGTGFPFPMYATQSWTIFHVCSKKPITCVVNTAFRNSLF